VFFGVAFAGLGVLCLLNVLADPMRVFGTPRWHGVNHRGPDVSGFDRMVKAYEIERLAPRTVVIGSSRVLSGFSGVEHWPVRWPAPVYNYSLLGANAVEIRRYVEHALAAAPVETVLWVADFFAFNADYTGSDTFVEGRLRSLDGSRRLPVVLEDYRDAGLGVESTRRSVLTLWNSLRDRLAAPAGETASSPSVRPWAEHFRNSERSYPSRWLPAPHHRYVFRREAGGPETFEQLEAILAACKKRGVRLILAYPPVHARLHEAMMRVGVWPQYEEWKRRVAERVRDFNARMGGDVPVWDFAIYNKATTEPVPGVSGTAARMDFYEDSAHFSPHFGQCMLRQFGLMDGALPEPLAVRVDAEPDLIGHLARVRAAHEAYRAAAPAEIAAVAAALEGLPVLSRPRE
jgi:hypothetical protein